MIEELDAFVNSQTPWMILSLVMILYIIKLQNDKLSKVCDALASLVLLYEKHDKQASEIHQETQYIHDWCMSRTGVDDCRPNTNNH